MRDIKFRAYVKIVGQICEVESINFDGGYIESKAFTQPMLFEHVTLLQFTGLTDKNGVDIYEGDIVEYWSLFECHSDAVDYFGVEAQNNYPVSEVYLEKKAGVVEFKDGQFSVCGKNVCAIGGSVIERIIECHWNDQLGESISEFLYEFHDGKFNRSIKKQVAELEVIGNIHQNPELTGE